MRDLQRCLADAGLGQRSGSTGRRVIRIRLAMLRNGCVDLGIRNLDAPALALPDLELLVDQLVEDLLARGAFWVES